MLNKSKGIVSVTLEKLHEKLGLPEEALITNVHFDPKRNVLSVYTLSDEDTSVTGYTAEGSSLIEFTLN